MRHWLPLLLLATACEPRFNWKWTALGEIEHATPGTTDASAVILRREERILNYAYFARRTARFTHEVQLHDVIQILSEAGLKYSEVRIPSDENDELSLLKARTISPSGEIRELDPKRILSDSSQVGTADGSRKFHTKMFRFPNVVVGSVIEYVFTLHDSEHMLFWLSPRVLTNLPIRNYRLEIDNAGPMKYAFKVYNTNENFTIERGNDFGLESERVTLELHQLPAISSEAWAPEWRLREPRWSYRLINVGMQKIYPDWAAAMKQTAARLSSRKLYAGADLSRAFAGCADADRACELDHALDFVRTRARLIGFVETLVVRPLTAVLSTAQANNFEKALLLRAVLGTHFTAQLAFTIRRNEQTFDEDFPLPNQFDHMIVYLPPQPGVDQPLFVDPSCESCKVGEVPPWIEGHIALILGSRAANAFTADQVETEFVPVSGRSAAPAEEHISHAATIDAAGTLHDVVSIDRSGQTAIERQLATRKNNETTWQVTADKFIRTRAANGKLRHGSADSCDQQAAHCVREIEFDAAAYGAAEDRQLVVPLTLFGSVWEDRFRAPTRVNDIVWGEAHLVEETIRLKIPSGYTVSELPPAMSGSIPIAEFTFHASQNGSEILLQRHYQTRSGRMPASAYDDLKRFMDKLNDARHLVVVLAAPH